MVAGLILPKISCQSPEWLSWCHSPLISVECVLVKAKVTRHGITAEGLSVSVVMTF